jgi:hypothetical protein
VKTYMDGFIQPAARPRWTDVNLHAANQPKIRYEYIVTGKGAFPLNMLRYNQ